MKILTKKTVCFPFEGFNCHFSFYFYEFNLLLLKQKLKVFLLVYFLRFAKSAVDNKNKKKHIKEQFFARLQMALECG